MTNQTDYFGIYVFGFLETVSKYVKILAIAIIAFVNLLGMFLMQRNPGEVPKWS